jgi:hypothetical protein
MAHHGRRPRREAAMTDAYIDFIDRKAQLGSMDGFDPLWIPSFLFDFQQHLVDWSIRKGRSAIFADCGLGKTAMQLVWAENIVRQTNRPVLILTPLAVAHQTVAEAGKFDIEARRAVDGIACSGINVTNYERLHYFEPEDFAGCVCDESSILKSFDGTRRQQITEFMRKMRYRLLCTATAAPNDYIELGTSSEALGELGYTDMLTKFFKNDQNTVKPMRLGYRDKGKDFSALVEGAKWRFKGHAEVPFWRWVCSWARAVRRPSDLGFNDDRFVLPPLIERDHMVGISRAPDGMLFSLPAVGLKEQRDERRRTIQERCELAATLVAHTGDPALMWCHLNDEGDLLTEIVPGAVQISGSDDDAEKEERFIAFIRGEIRVLVTKQKIAGWGLNMQHCWHMTTFPSHSFESYYQGVRRCWRFGQTRPVTVDMITTEGEKSVLKNLQRKAKAADKMFSDLVTHMNQSIRIDRGAAFTQPQEAPQWLMSANN